MEGIKNLNLNVSVTIFSPDSQNNGGTSSKIFRGRIYNREPDQNVVIELESDSGHHFFTAGKPILLFLAHDLGLYIFSAVVNRVEKQGGKTVLYCNNPQQVKYFQRRKSVRVSVTIPASFSTESNHARVWDGTITDISVGGLKLEAPFLVSPGSVVELVYQIEEGGPMFMDGRVVRAFERDGRCIHGIEFVNPDNYSIDSIAKFIMAEQMRQKRLGLNMFKAFILEATVEMQAPTVFGIIRYKNLDISALQGKKCNGTIMEIGIHSLRIECLLKLPLGAVLEFSVELPKLGYTTIQATVTEITSRMGKFVVVADYSVEYTKIRDCVLERLAREFDVPYIGGGCRDEE